MEHFHLWSLASTEPSLTATVTLADQSLSSAGDVVRLLERELAGRFGIRHTVLQVEAAGETDGAVLHRC